jgi:hypothetical protein
MMAAKDRCRSSAWCVVIGIFDLGEWSVVGGWIREVDRKWLFVEFAAVVVVGLSAGGGSLGGRRLFLSLIG